MPANGTSALDTLNWGTGVAETTSTLGVDRQDVRTPPDTSHIWGAQISQCKNLLLTMSAYFKGGARLQLLTQGSNPFSVGENGLYMDTGGTVYKVVNGTPSALGGGGGSSTLATAYTTGASQTDSTMLLDSTRLGVRIRDNASPVAGSLFQVQSSGGTTTFLDINAASSLVFRSGMADGASAVAAITDTTTAWSTTGHKLHVWKSNNVEQVSLKYNAYGLSEYLLTSTGATTGVQNNTLDGFFTQAGTVQITVGGGGQVRIASGALSPSVDLTATSGTSIRRWSENWSRRYAGVEQTIAAAATITLDPAAGESIRVTLGATGITTVNGAAGYPGEVMRVEIIQDGTGSRTISGFASGTNGFQLIGGAYTPTATANKRDVLNFMWDATASKWIEYTARATNV